MRMGKVKMLLAILWLAIGTGAASAGEKMPVRFSLDWIVGGRHAGWFTALEKGYYDEAGLKVTISRGYGSEDGTKRLMSGESDINFNDIAGIVLARSRLGAKVKVVGVIYAKHPSVIFTLKKAGIKTPKDLEGKTVVDSPGSTQVVLFPAFARAAGIDAAKVNWVLVPPDAKNQMLLSGKAQGMGIYVMQRPILEKAAAAMGGIDQISYSDHLNMYGNGILVAEDFLARNPDAVKRFVKASIKGFLYAFDHPDEAAGYVLKQQPLLDKDVTKAEGLIVRDIAWTPEARQHGLGFMEEAKMRITRDLMFQLNDLKTPVALEDLYTNKFLMEP
jgi:NitT/TauT family transport system substrate-binding protein